MRKFFNRPIAILIIIFFVVGTVPSMSYAKQLETDYDKFELVATADGGMVSTSHGLATQIGAEVLRKGGNAIDAAIAVQYALTVVEPMMSGIGGGGFMMVYDGETEETTIVNSR